VIDLFKYSKEIYKLFSSSDNILLISHINPDGDSIGAQLALYHFLKTRGKNIEMLTPNSLQDFLKWMDGANLINVFTRDRKKCNKIIENADIIVMLDFNKPNRLGEAESAVIASGKKKIIIDHHLDPGDFGDIIISDTARCSTSEIVYDLVTEMNGGNFINKSYAEALYTGIITDTGNFEYGTYTSQTLRIVAELLDAGIDRDKILDLIYNNFSAERFRLQGFALYERMVVLPELNTAYIYLTKKDLADFKHVKGDTEGFVNMPLSIKGIRFAVLFIEKDNFIKLSFRSKGTFPSNVFASKYFSGGGHMNASGGEYNDTLENTIQFFLKILKENVWRFNENA
jgi:bifunctional oligoribonuclease and PAP phosphatase NrnA